MQTFRYVDETACPRQVLNCRLKSEISMVAHSKCFARWFACILAIAAPISAQTNTGEINGRVTDKSEAVIPNVRVQVKSVATADVRETVSNAEGYFAVTFLTPGSYEVMAAAQGFTSALQSGIKVGAGQRVNLSLTLDVGSVTEEVRVTATAQQVNTEDAKVRHVIDASQAKDLPLNGRIMSHLLMVIPGVAVTTDLSVTDIAASLTNYSANGARGVYNMASIDGGFNLDSGSMGSQTNQVSPDWVQEVSIVTSGYSAEYGRNSGVQINFATRSGTKDFHGALYEFFRNDKMDARSFFSPAKDKLRFNNFGWTLGGPITIPGKFNTSRQKLFFFAGQEFRRRRQNQLMRATTPTSAERSGIINSTTQLVYPVNFPVVALRGQPITDPSRATPANPTGANIIPKQYITPNGQAIMNIYQSMIGLAGEYSDTATPNNTTFQLPNPDTRREDIVKVDYHVNEYQRLAFSMLYGTGSNDTAFVQGPYPTHGFTRRNRARTGRVIWTDVISPTTVNRLTAQVNYLNIRWPALGDRDQAGQYGVAIKEMFGNDIQAYGIPAIAITGYSSISGSAGAWQAPTADFSLMDDLNHMRGSHNLKAGLMAVRNRKNEADNTTSRLLMGNVSFSAAGNPNTTGNALADALLGNFTSWRESQNLVFQQVRFSDVEAYVADTLEGAAAPQHRLRCAIRLVLSESQRREQRIEFRSAILGPRISTARDSFRSGRGQPSARYRESVQRTDHSWNPVLQQLRDTVRPGERSSNQSDVPTRRTCRDREELFCGHATARHCVGPHGIG